MWRTLGSGGILECAVYCEFGNIIVLNGINATGIYISQLAQLLHINAPFEEHNIVRSHATKIFPSVIWVMFDRICLAFAVRIEACDGEHVVLGVDTSKITECERPLQCRNGYGSPQVDYLETTLQDRWCFIWKATTDYANRGREGLVNVSPLDRLSLVGVSVSFTNLRLVTAND